MKTRTAKSATQTAAINQSVKLRHPKSPTPENPHGWLRRNWLAIVLFVICAFLALDEALFKTLGTLIYVPVLGFLAIICAMFARRMLAQHTTDADAADGTFNLNWAKLETSDCTPGIIAKCALQVIERIAYLAIFAYIAASVIK